MRRCHCWFRGAPLLIVCRRSRPSRAPDGVPAGWASATLDGRAPGVIGGSYGFTPPCGRGRLGASHPRRPLSWSWHPRATLTGMFPSRARQIRRVFEASVQQNTHSTAKSAPEDTSSRLSACFVAVRAQWAPQNPQTTGKSPVAWMPTRRGEPIDGMWVPPGGGVGRGLLDVRMRGLPVRWWLALPTCVL